MNSRLLHIALAQTIALFLSGFYAQHLLNHFEYGKEQAGVRGFNLGVTAMALQTSMAGVAGTDDQNHKIFEERKNLQMKDQNWRGLDDFMAGCLLAIPAGVLSVLVIVSLLLEARYRKKIGGDVGTRQTTCREQVDY